MRNKYDTRKKYHEDIAKAFQLGLAFGFGEKYDEMDKMIGEIKKIIKSQSKTGYWIYDDEHSSWSNLKYKCSCCKREIIVPYEVKDDVYKDYPYCHCGAKMVESEDEE